MSAAERLAAAFLSGVPEETWVGAYPFLHIDGELVQNILAADPDLAQDIEDGAALRRLAAVVPAGWEAVARFGGWHKWPMVEVWDPAYPTSRDDPEQPRYISSEATIAAAADACRVALEAGR